MAPSPPRRTCWQVPFVVGLSPPPCDILATIDLAIACLFAMDVVLNFFTALSEAGRSGQVRGWCLTAAWASSQQLL